MNSAVDPSGRVLLPTAVRAALQLTEGAQVTFHIREDVVVLTRHETEEAFSKWRGTVALPFGENVDEYLAILRAKK